MATVTLTNIHGFKHKVPLSGTAQLITIVPGLIAKGGGRFQILGNSEWLYSHQDEGSTADNWLTVAAGRDGGFDSGSRSFSFYAKLASGTANLHVVEL